MKGQTTDKYFPIFKFLARNSYSIFTSRHTDNPMEPNDVLKKFLDVCSNKDDNCTRYSFASNGVLEWFGRNVKDNNKIFEYIR